MVVGGVGVGVVMRPPPTPPHPHPLLLSFLPPLRGLKGTEGSRLKADQACGGWKGQGSQHREGVEMRPLAGPGFHLLLASVG